MALVRHTYTDGWYLPGGGVKKGESFETALHRELKEEVALSNAKIERVLGIYHSRRDRQVCRPPQDGVWRNTKPE